MNLTDIVLEEQKAPKVEDKPTDTNVKTPEEPFYTISPTSQEYLDLKAIETIVHVKIESLLQNCDKDPSNIDKCLSLINVLEKYRGAKINITAVASFHYPVKMPKVNDRYN